MQPFDCDTLPFRRRPGPVGDLPVVSVLAFQFLPVILECVEQVRLVMFLPDLDLLADVPQETELFVGLVAVEDLCPSGDLLPD